MSTLDDETEDAGPASSDRRVSRRAKIWGWTGVGVLVLIASWFGWQQAQEPVRWSDVGFSIDSPTQATVTFDVFIYKNVPIECHLRALNKSFAEVGVETVQVAYSAGSQQRLTVPISTTEEATTAVVKYCQETKQ